MYSIKFLGNKEFDALPKEVTKGSRIDDSLGFYNPDLKQAYIRWTAYPEVNKYLLDHEFDHMVEDHATDADENGIRHKKKNSFMKLFDNLWNPTSWVNPEKQSGLLFPLTSSQSPISMSHPNKENDAMVAQQNEQKQMLDQQNSQMQSQYMNSPAYQSIFGNPAGSQGSAASLSGGNSLGDSSQGALNQGLSQQSTNPFADQYQYGAPAGRLVF